MNYKNLVLNCSFAFYIFSFTLTCFAQDKAVAIVNNDIITQKDLNDFINFMRMQLSAEYKGAQLENKIQSMKLDLLDRLIDDKLILQEARNQKISIDENRIKSRIDEIKSKIGSDAEFQKYLRQQGLVQADLETKVREQLLMYHIIEMKVKNKIEISPSEITDFYDRNKEEFKIREQRDFESLAFDDEVMSLQAYDELREGLSIEEITDKYKAQTNRFSTSKGDELKKDIENVIFNLKVNEVSKPVKIENKFYIFRLNKIIPPRQQTLQEAEDTIQDYLFDRKMQEVMDRWLDELKERAYIKILSD